MENMQARNEKKSYCLSNERAAELMSKTERCSVIVTPQREIGRECKIDVMAATIETAREIKDNIRPEKQGDAINPQYAAEFGELSRRVEDKYNSNSENNKER